jgi:hypothetical protein
MKELQDLHAFADGELTLEETRTVRVWIASDPIAQEELNSISNLKDFLRDQSSRHTADDCWKVCVKRLNELDRSRKVEWFVGKYAWAVCAGLFLVVIGGRYVASDTKGETVQAADFGFFHTSHQAPSPQLQRLFDQILAESRANRSNVRVYNVQVGQMKDTAVEKCTLVDDHGALSYFVAQDVFQLDGASELTQGSGLWGGIVPRAGDSTQPLNYVMWLDGGTSHVLIGPRSIEDLGQAAIQDGLKTSMN